MEDCIMYLSIGEKARECGVSVATLRRWDKRGLLKPDIITAGGHRRYKNKNRTEVKRRIIAYARVSSYDQKADLEKQKDVLSAHNPDVLLSDIGSGINFNKPGFKKLINLLLTGQIKRIIITYPDRLLRFGFSLIEKLCQHFWTEMTILNLKKEQSFEETLAQDLITIITVFSSKLYGKRFHQNKIKKSHNDLIY